MPSRGLMSRLGLIAALMILLSACVLLSLGVGSSGIGLLDLGDEHARTILLQIRLPRILLALFAGAALSAAGTGLQSMLGNPLAEPFVLGISGGGAAGAIIAMTLGLGVSWALPLLAAAGGLATLLMVHFLARVGGRVPRDRLILAGFVMNVVLGALISFLLVLRMELMHGFTFWVMGSLSTTHLSLVLTVGLYVLVGILLLWLESAPLNALSLGEETARSLGVEVERVKLRVAVLSALLAGAIVAVAGMIAFVGLIVPHIARRFVGPDARFLIPVSALGGAAFLVLCDLAARTMLSPAEIPVGVVTALIGGPFFFLILRRGTGGRS